MKKFLSLLLILLMLATGCATTIEPTSQPVNNPPTAVPVNPNVQVAPSSGNTPTPLPPPPAATNKCQSKLTGRIYDAKGALVKGATVEIKSGNLTAKTLSDDNGLYGFAGLCAGTYAFSAQLPGQAPKALATRATVSGGDSIKADLSLK